MRTIRVGIAGLLVLALACSESDPTSTAIPQEGAADVPAGDMAATTTGARAYGVDAESHVVLFRLDRPGRYPSACASPEPAAARWSASTLGPVPWRRRLPT